MEEKKVKGSARGEEGGGPHRTTNKEDERNRRTESQSPERVRE